jgi:hypothetical protein
MSRWSTTVCLICLSIQCMAAYQLPQHPFAPAAGEDGSTALAHDDRRFSGWADAVESVIYGTEVADEWKQPAAALGPAAATDPDVLVLGRGGEVVLAFEPAIRDGDGDDFAVFENAINDSFLELAHVEVSSDGRHFVRFPGFSYSAGPIGAFGSVSASNIHGLAGKYRAGYGTPFDLRELADAHAAVLGGFDGFSAEFSRQLLDGFPNLDLGNIRYVRIIDIPGDGRSRDCQGFPIYDPYPTVITAGFDLDAVGVIHRAASGLTGFAEWSSGYGLPAEPMLDTDGDRWVQLLEYYMASDPRDAASRPVTRLTTGAAGNLVMEFTRSLSAQGGAEWQVSADGSAWTPYDGEEQTIGSGGSGAARWSLQRISVPGTGGTVLMRLAASAP